MISLLSPGSMSEGDVSEGVRRVALLVTSEEPLGSEGLRILETGGVVGGEGPHPGYSGPCGYPEAKDYKILG